MSEVDINSWQWKLGHWWLEYRYRFRQRWIHPWYYPIKDYFFPHNVLKIRNTPRSWNDRSERVVHAVFSMLADYLEREKGGREEFAKKIADVRAYADEKERQGNEWEPKQCRYQADNDAEILAIYDWYMSVDWENPEGIDWSSEMTTERCRAISAKEDAFTAKTEEMLIRAIKTRGAWWT